MVYKQYATYEKAMLKKGNILKANMTKPPTILILPFPQENRSYENVWNVTLKITMKKQEPAISWK